MKALLKLITTEDRARELLAVCTRKGYSLLHKNHQEPLTESIIAEGGFTVNFGGYGSYSRLGLGNNFGTKWEISGLEAPANKGFTEVEVCFGAGLDTVIQKAIAEYILKQGGSVVEEGEGNCDLCILAATNGDAKNLLELMSKMVDGAKGFLTIRVDEFLEVIPAIKKPRPKAAKLSDELKQLQKQLQERSHDSIRSALQALKGRDAEVDLLIQEVSVDPKTGELDRGPRFKGTGPAMEFLDLALMGLLSQAGENSQAAKIRGTVKKLKLAVKALPRLSGFGSLEELEIIFNRIKDNEHTEKVADLKVFGQMPSLRKLRLAHEPGYANKSLLIQSLDGLDAAPLENLEASDIGLECIAALSGCPKLRSIDLSRNPALSGIEALSNCSSIEILRLNETCITSLEPLAAARGLTELTINDCRALKSIQGLHSTRLDAFELRELDLTSLDGLDNLYNLKTLDLAGLRKLKDLAPLSKLDKLEKLELYNLTSIQELPVFEQQSGLSSISIHSCDALADVSSLATAKALQSVEVSECRKLRSGPVTWPDSLQKLTLEQTQLSELGACPSSLIELGVSNNGNLKNLDGLRACTQLEVSSWGFDLTGCYKLENLDGLNLPKLEAINIPETLTNLDALKRYPGIAITVVAGLGVEQGYRSVVKDIPAALGDALLQLAPSHLTIRTEWRAELQTISGIGRVKSLTSLDLSGCDLVDITGIAGLEKLEFLKVQARTELSKSLGKATFDSRGQIEKLWLRLLAGL